MEPRVELTSADAMPVRAGDRVWLVRESTEPPRVEARQVGKLVELPGGRSAALVEGVYFSGSDLYRSETNALRKLASVLHADEARLWKQWQQVHAALTACHFSLAATETPR